MCKPEDTESAVYITGVPKVKGAAQGMEVMQTLEELTTEGLPDLKNRKSSKWKAK